jgi:uncharacterized membrane protein YphA (DoxX/SURF4 family)
MRLREQVALTLPSLFLRLVLGITFIWAGTGKLVGTTLVVGDDAARLANIGVMPTAPSAPPTTTDPNDSTDTPPTEPPPAAVDDPQVLDEATKPENGPENEPKSDDLIDQANEIIEQLSPPANEDPDQPTTEDDKASLQSVQYNGTRYAAADFPEPMEIRRVYTIALMLSKAGDPGLTAESNPIIPTMPAMVASKPWAKILAWAAAITELGAGVFLLLGLLTRISSLGTLSVMLTALWMTQFGPAALHSSDAILGFIPRVADPWAPMSYIGLLWQLALAAMSLAVFFLGSGPIGIDRMLFKPTRRDPYLHGDPKAAKATKTKPADESTAQDRTAFDRTPNPTP